MGAMQEPDVCPSEHRNDNIHVRCLHEACVLLGGEHHLAKYLGVDVTSVEKWLAGDGTPPDWVFVRCADLVLAKSPR
jgi:hypothetical protein